ncbi:MAG TPA: hypothetical protein VFW64_11895, partial [Pseudonocardiaceae bacterium]|nr:hypothetical protein [Pseudonocardiaceae bacterium]
MTATSAPTWRRRCAGRAGCAIAATGDSGWKDLEAEHGAAFRSLIDQLAGPRPASEGIPDPRSTPQRNAEALLEICGLA